MPSKSISFSNHDLYGYIVDTMDGNFSERVQELCEKGREAEVQDDV